MTDKEMYRKAYELCEDAAMARRMVAEIKRKANVQAKLRSQSSAR